MGEIKRVHCNLKSIFPKIRWEEATLNVHLLVITTTDKHIKLQRLAEQPSRLS